MAENKFPTEVVDLPSKGYFYPEDNPLSTRQVEMRYMTAKDEDILTSQKLIQKGTVLDVLLRELIIDKKINLDDILIGDKNALLVAARVLAYGKEYEFEYTNELYAPYVFIRYFLIILVGFAPFFLLSFNSKLKIKIVFFKNFNNLLYPVLIILPPVLVLFSMGTDWGRWVNISYTFTVLFYFYLFKNNLLEVNLDKITRRISFFNNKKFLAILCFIIYAFGWSPQTGMTGDVSSIPGYRLHYKSIKMLFYQINQQDIYKHYN